MSNSKSKEEIPQIIEAKKEITNDDLRKSLSRLLKPNIINVTKLIYDNGPLTPNKLQEMTGLSTAALNRVTIEMKNLNLIVQEKKKEEYQITNYCVGIMSCLNYLRDGLSKTGGEILFSARCEKVELYFCHKTTLED
jgi:hypothetical protein